MKDSDVRLTNCIHKDWEGGREEYYFFKTERKSRVIAIAGLECRAVQELDHFSQQELDRNQLVQPAIANESG